MEHSLGLLKPDCLERGLDRWALKKVQDYELEIVLTKRLTFTPELVDAFYPQCRLRDYYGGLCTHLCSGPSLVYIVRGEDAIDRLSALVGFNEPAFAAPGTIRSQGESIRRNLAHSSENFDQFFREAVVIFTKEEVMGMIRVR